jgi:hypothetical protein
MLIKPLMRNVSLLNMVLLSAAAVFALYSLFPLLDVRIKYALPTPGKGPEIAKVATDELQTPSVTEYAVISEENLFHPDRKIPVEKKAEQPLPKPDFIVFGTLITGNTSLAYLEDLKAPRSTAGRGKRQIALKKGDTLSGFTLKEIEADKIVMVRGSETITLPVNPRDRTAATAAATAPTAAATPQKPAPQAPAAISGEQRRQEIQAAREERMQRIRAAREARQLRRQQKGAGQE